MRRGFAENCGVAVVDPQGVATAATAAVVSEANQYQRAFAISSDGHLLFRDLPFGKYTLMLRAAGRLRALGSCDRHSIGSPDLDFCAIPPKVRLKKLAKAVAWHH